MKAASGGIGWKRNAEHPRWNGGGRIQRGYHYIWDSSKQRYKKRSRLVMEIILGRKLETHEEVHHIDGDKLNDKWDNLELWSRSHPAGIRVPKCPHCDKPLPMELLDKYSEQ